MSPASSNASAPPAARAMTPSRGPRRALGRAAPALLWLLAVLLVARIAARWTVDADDPLVRAEQELAQGDLKAAASGAAEALRVQPLDGRAYRVLARVALTLGDPAITSQRLAQALRYSPRDTQARALAADAALERGAAAEAIAHLDILLRLDPSLGDRLFPVLTQLAGTPDGVAPLLEQLRRRPLWRSEFVPAATRLTPRIGQLEPLMVGLSATGGLDAAESRAFFDRYVSEGRWDEAYRVWLRLLPDERRTSLTSPTNGDFETATVGGAPFEWSLSAPEGIEAAIAPDPDGKGHVLRMVFTGGREPFQGVRQLLLLPQGRSYSLHWRSRVDGLETPRGVNIEISCATDRSVLLSTAPERGSHGWTAAGSRFDVPARCSAQWLRLGLAARTALENQAVGSASWDDVAILDPDSPTGE